MPGNSSDHPVASVPNVHSAPMLMMPWGWYPKTYLRSAGRSVTLTVVIG